MDQLFRIERYCNFIIFQARMSPQTPQRKSGLFYLPSQSKTLLLLKWKQFQQAQAPRLSLGPYSRPLNLICIVLRTVMPKSFLEENLFSEFPLKIRFLIHELGSSEPKFFKLHQGKLELKAHFKLHFYVSYPPCGDWMIHCFDKDGSGATGAKPVYCQQCEQQSDPCYHKFKVRYKSCRSDTPEEKRSKSLSCSDKIIKWNYLGIQGGKLSTYFKSIRFSSITLANVELESKTEQDQIIQAIQYSLNLKARFPSLFDQDIPIPEIKLLKPGEKSYLFCKRIQPGYRASGFSLGWQIRDKASQIIVGILGLRQGANKQSLPKLAVSCSICNSRLYCDLVQEQSITKRKELLKKISEPFK